MPLIHGKRKDRAPLELFGALDSRKTESQGTIGAVWCPCFTENGKSGYYWSCMVPLNLGKRKVRVPLELYGALESRKTESQGTIGAVWCP